MRARHERGRLASAIERKGLTMKCAKMFSSMLIPGFLAGGAALLLAGCNPQVKIGSDSGSDSMAAKEAKGAKAYPAVNCRVKLVNTYAGMFGDGSLPEVSLSNRDLTATAQKLGMGKANAGHITGKWYFEVHIDQLLSDGQGGIWGGIWWAQKLGVAVDEAIASAPDMAQMGAAYTPMGEITAGRNDLNEVGVDIYETGDLIGAALDLDSGRIYFSKNGVWLNGDPGAGTGGIEVLTLPGTGAYYPFLGVSGGDQMTANFGETRFANSPPAGFLPYAQGFTADQAGDCQDPGPAGRPADPAPMTASCTDFESYDAGSAGGTELHILGVSEAKGGQSNVQVDRHRPLVLVLSSSNAVQWNVTAGPGAQIERIILSSYDLSSVSAPQGIPVDSFSYAQNGEYVETGFGWPATVGGGDTQTMIKELEAKAGLTMTSFGGCYTGGSFTVTD
jgi:hypothetical protein